MMTNNWMDDPAVAHIDSAKLDFLQSLVFESQSLTKEQMLPFLMSVAKKGMDSHITFSSEEVETITSTIRKYSTPEELDKIDKLEKLMKQRKK
ncbi:MAG: hypothetical protein J1F42_04880 [Lachnospiraceae bacterium]|nr:hypothetical protein [Lachnospiraceae bacterium]